MTGDGHGVAGLLYGPDGTLLTGGQLAAVRRENRPAGTAPNPLPILAPSGAASVAPVSREAGPPGCSVTGIAPPEGASTMNAHGAGARNPAVPVEAATRVTANGVSRTALFERSASAFGFTLGERGALVVLFGDPSLCPWSRSAVARIGREAMAGKLRLHVVPVALLGATSAHRAAGIAASSDPAEAWFARDGSPAGRHARDRITRNNALFDSWGERSVPLIAYRTARGGAAGGGIAHRVGDIADLGAWLRELGHE